jgi:hypothetical protein
MTAIDEYLELLKSHDWQFEHTDDQQVWRKGAEELRKLWRLRSEVDPNGTLWNSYAPVKYRVAW